MGSIRIVAGLTCAALALAACAGPLESRRANDPIRALLSADVMMLVSFDADGDAVVTAAEIDAGLAREFARADANGDGYVQPIEFQSWSNLVLGGGMLGPYRLDFDRNVDNTITREEFDAEIRARVAHYDENESGALERSEFIRLVGTARPPSRRLTPSMPPSS